LRRADARPRVRPPAVHLVRVHPPRMPPSLGVRKRVRVPLRQPVVAVHVRYRRGRRGRGSLLRLRVRVPRRPRLLVREPCVRRRHRRPRHPGVWIEVRGGRRVGVFRSSRPSGVARAPGDGRRRRVRVPILRVHELNPERGRHLRGKQTRVRRGDARVDRHRALPRGHRPLLGFFREALAARVSLFRILRLLRGRLRALGLHRARCDRAVACACVREVRARACGRRRGARPVCASPLARRPRLRNQHPNEGDASKSDFHPEKIPSVRFLLEVLLAKSGAASQVVKNLRFFGHVSP